jgi:hypothetical protein
MTTPLVERLRNLFAMSDDRARQTRDEAADRIEKLEKAVREELDRLRPWTDRTHSGEPCTHPACLATQRLTKALEAP